MDIATAKQLSNFYMNIRSVVDLINQGGVLNSQCQFITNNIAKDANFAIALSIDEQAWVTSLVTFFNSLATQLPVTPDTILSAIQS